jgi:short-subunit dehydrogenase
MDGAAFRDNAVILTGASLGIGRAVALRLAEQGARLALAARTADRLEAIADECRQRGGQAIAVPTDIADREQCRLLVERTVEHYGRVDTLINNAAVGMTSHFVDLHNLDVFERVVAVDLFGPVYCTHFALPHLSATRGRIVTVSSLKGLFANARADGYTASKHALGGFFDSLRIELAGRGVSVTVVYPPWVSTGVSTRALDENGEPWGGLSRHERGAMSPDACAAVIVEAAARRKRAAVMTVTGKLGRWTALAMPSLTDRVVARKTD